MRCFLRQIVTIPSFDNGLGMAGVFFHKPKGDDRTADNFGDLFSATTRTSVGAGFRYRLARQLGLRVGLDVARGPEDTYVYLVMESAWSRGL